MRLFNSQALPRKDVLLAAFLLGFFWTFANQLLVHGPSADLMALWMAADAFAEGRFDSIYPAETGYFPMLPPADWAPKVEELGHVGAYYPYVYPPLFAALAAPLTDIMDYTSFLRIASHANVLMLIASIVLAARASRLSMRLPTFIVISLVALATSKISLLALHENQPQILVTLFLVIAIERSVAGKSIAAGAALAAATAIKVYPLFFVVVYLMRQDWRAVASFAVVGGVLGGLSILLAGWPLHEAFLEQIRAISATVMVTGNSYNLNTILAAFFAQTNLIEVDAALAGSLQGTRAFWEVLQKPVGWQLLDTLAVLGIAIGFGFAMRRMPVFSVPLFLGLLGSISLTMPLSWAYYFIPLLLFSPTLIEYYGKRQGTLILLLGLLASVFFIAPVIRDSFETAHVNLIPAVAGLLILILAFSLAPRTRHVN